jgi:hypothetical protein
MLEVPNTGQQEDLKSEQSQQGSIQSTGFGTKEMLLRLRLLRFEILLLSSVGDFNPEVNISNSTNRPAECPLPEWRLGGVDSYERLAITSKAAYDYVDELDLDLKTGISLSTTFRRANLTSRPIGV